MLAVTARTAKRTPAAKFVRRNYSPARRAKLPMGWNIGQSHNPFQPIFKTAESILGLKLERGTTIIFIGQGMRPLFEATRALNEIDMKLPRNSIRYIITPERRMNKGGKLWETTFKIIKKRRVVSKGGRYVIVDFSWNGNTLGSVARAIKTLQPSAEITQITHDKPGFQGIESSDNIPRPTIKSKRGTLRTTSTKLPNGKIVQTNLLERARYLAFQIALQKYLDKRQKSRNSETAQ